MILFDKTAVMGSRSAPLVCQKITNFIRHIMLNLQYFVANYVDDFMGLDTPQRIWSSYNALGNLLRDIGATESLAKAVPPTYLIEFLGVLFDLKNHTISVTEDRMEDICEELHKWRDKVTCTRRELESLLGKLQFISNCVRLGRILVLRLRNQLSGMPVTGLVKVTAEMSKDVEWWIRYLPWHHKVSIM